MSNPNMDEASLNNVRPFIEKVLKETGFKMENPDKLARAIYGMDRQGGEKVGGVGEQATSDIILAKYDEYNGYITKKGYKVKNRAFFHPKTKTPIPNPKIVYLIKFGDKMIEHEEGATESLEVQVAKKEFEKTKDEQKKRGPGRPKKTGETEEPKNENENDETE